MFRPLFYLTLCIMAFATAANAASFDLIAGQNTVIGSVDVSSDGTDLTVSFNTIDDWGLVETHLQISKILGDIPQKRGNPIPGAFDLKHEGLGEDSTDTYTINLAAAGFSSGDSLFIAAHAAVKDVIEQAPFSASIVISAMQGLRKNGTPVLLNRSNPNDGLVPGGAFFSLGFGGKVVLLFDCPIQNGPGDDVAVYEITNGSYPPESVSVEASTDGLNWVNLGTATNGRSAPSSGGSSSTITSLDLGALSSALYIRITDTTDSSLHSSTADSFDLDGVSALQSCTQEETAWGAGSDFSGKNWATYFEFTLP